jgi:hypothetical protein
MNQELKLGLLELNDIYYCLSTVSRRDMDVHRSKEMAELADRVLDHIVAKCKDIDELIADARAYYKETGNE